MPRAIRPALLLVVICFAGCTSIERLAIPSAQAIDHDWRADRAGAVDHSPWDAFLQRYARTDANGTVRVDYGAVSDDDQRSLEAYVAALEDSGPDTTSKPARLAYWVNLYNAATVVVILEHYPVASIRGIRRHPLDPGPWDEARLFVAGRALSLHDIEHGIVRPGWAGTPEVHYLLNCAAVGCPNLGLAAYTADNVTSALGAAARSYVNDPRGVTLRADGDLRLSNIYAWYREDFGANERALLEHLQRYAAPPLL